MTMVMQENRYNEFQDYIIQQKGSIKEHIHGSKRTIYNGSVPIATLKVDRYLQIGNLSQQKFNAFLAAFMRVLYSEFRKNEYLFSLKINEANGPRLLNRKSWNKLKTGNVFYNIDLKSAYWQICRKLGYINQSFFEKYMYLDEYRHAKRYCVSFLARENYMMSVNDSGEDIKIICNTDIFKNVYDNVRFELYHTIHNLIDNIEGWLCYNVDAVMIKKSDLNLVKDRLESQGLIYVITECIKIDNTEYLYGENKIKQFK